MPEIFILETLHEVKKGSWDNCFAWEVEKYDYLLAVETAGIKGFKWRYITAWHNGELFAAMPAFLSDYELDTTLQGKGKKITNGVKSIFPNLLKLKLASLGSPCTEAGIIGFHPDVNDDGKENLLKKMITAFEKYAASNKCKLIGIKDIPDHQKKLWDKVVAPMKYGALPSLATAYIDIDFRSLEEYMLRLSASTRKDMKRKLKSREDIIIVYRHNIDDVLPQVLELYYDTRNRSDWQFEELTERYFRDVLVNMKENSFCTLYYAEEKLLAANLLIHDDKTLVDKFFCMNSSEGRPYNLYFLSWFNNLEYCLKSGLSRYQSGQAYYENKVKLGSKLTRNWMYFKHRNFIAHGILKLVSPLLSGEDDISQKVAA